MPASRAQRRATSLGLAGALSYSRFVTFLGLAAGALSYSRCRRPELQPRAAKMAARRQCIQLPARKGLPGDAV